MNLWLGLHVVLVWVSFPSLQDFLRRNSLFSFPLPLLLLFPPAFFQLQAMPIMMVVVMAAVQRKSFSC